LGTRSFKSVGDTLSDKKYNRELDTPPVGIKTPLRRGYGRSGIFDMHFNIRDQISDNLKNLLLTNHGERLGLYDFGANLRPLTTELHSQEDFDGEAMSRIRDAVSKYMPFINLDSFESSFKQPPDSESVAQITIRILYSVPQLQVDNAGIEVILYCIG